MKLCQLAGRDRTEGRTSQEIDYCHGTIIILAKQPFHYDNSLNPTSPINLSQTPEESVPSIILGLQCDFRFKMLMVNLKCVYVCV